MIRRTVSTTRIVPSKRVDFSYLTYFVLVILLFGSIFIVELTITIKWRQLKLHTAHRRPATKLKISNQTNYDYGVGNPDHTETDYRTKMLFEAAEVSFDRRNQMLWETCKKHNLDQKYQPVMDAFIILPKHRIRWCNSVASRSLSQYFINSELEVVEQTRNDLLKRNLAELEVILSKYLSVLTVSDPFERLLAAYRNLIKHERQNVSDKYRFLRKKIVEKNRGKSNVSSELPGPTFREFLLYLVDHQKYPQATDVHWSPIYQMCAPCTIYFKIVTKAETIQRDVEYIANQAGLDKIRDTIRIYNVVNLPEMIKEKYFSQIDEYLLSKVFEMYELDFTLFGYNSTTYFKYASYNRVTIKPPKWLSNG